MNMNVTCPICQNDRNLPEGAEGRKWRCGTCGSVHRILASDSGYALKTLEEAIYSGPVQPEMAMSAEAEESKAPVGPKLHTRRDKFREDEPKSRPKRVTRGSSRRSRLR